MTQLPAISTFEWFLMICIGGLLGLGLLLTLANRLEGLDAPAKVWRILSNLAETVAWLLAAGATLRLANAALGGCLPIP